MTLASIVNSMKDPGALETEFYMCVSIDYSNHIRVVAHPCRIRGVVEDTLPHVNSIDDLASRRVEAKLPTECKDSTHCNGLSTRHVTHVAHMQVAG